MTSVLDVSSRGSDDPEGSDFMPPRLQAIDAELASLRERAAVSGRPLDDSERERTSELLAERAEVQQSIDAEWAWRQSLESQAATQSSIARDRARSDIQLGGALFLLGLGISLASYFAFSGNGGIYLLFWGPMLFGVIRLIRGVLGTLG
jgi:hypothetical protein